MLSEKEIDMDTPLVSITCTTFNHEKFIKDAVEGFLAQKINFPTEIIIHDDCSTDRTPEIIRDFTSRYPKIIKPIFQRENQYSRGIKPWVKYVYPACKGKYIAFCEGDDHWTDPFKLQKQFDFMEANDDYSICYHNAKIIDENGVLLSESKLTDGLKRDFSSDELIKGPMLLTLTIFFRNVLKNFPLEIFNVKNGDKFLISLIGNFGRGKYLENVEDAVYHKHALSIWSSLSKIRQIYYNGETRAWLSRYYNRIGKPSYADYFRNETIKHFKCVINEIISNQEGIFEDILIEIEKEYSDLLDKSEIHKIFLPLEAAMNNFQHNDTLSESINSDYQNQFSKIKLIAHTVSQNSKSTHNQIVRAGSRELFENNEEYIVNWVVTRKCNYSCSYCRVYTNKDVFKTLSDLKRAVDKLSELNRKKFKITLTGGEPTLYPHYAEFLKYIIKKLSKKTKVITITNLGRTEKYFAGLCEKMKGYEKNFSFVASYHFDFAKQEKFIRNIRTISGMGFYTKVQVMAHPEKMTEVRALETELNKIQNEQLVYKITIIRENYGSIPDKRYSKDDLQWLKTYYTEDDQKNMLISSRTDDDSIQENCYHPAEINAKGLNKYKGMICEAGLRNISIDELGRIERAVCFRGNDQQSINIYNDAEAFSGFSKPVVCPFERCGCTADIPIPKYQPGFRNLNKEKTTDLSEQLNRIGWQGKRNQYEQVFISKEELNRIPKPAASVIVISWRLHPDTIKNFQILNKQREQNFELIFVDNGGKPAEFDILKPYIDTYIKLNKNTGAYLPRNIGTVFAKAPILIFLEDDGIPTDGFVKAHLNTHKENDVISVRGIYAPKTANPLNQLAGHYYLGYETFPIYCDLEGNVSYRAENFYTAGGWDDNIYFGGGGVDLSLRLLQTDPEKTKQIYSPNPIIFHDYARDQKHLDLKRAKQEQSRAYLRAKHPDYDAFLASWSSLKGRTDLIKKREIPVLNTATPFISIVIPTYNRDRFVTQAVQSALDQEASYTNFEVLVVDDGSTDETAGQLKAIQNPRFRYVLKEHSGAPATRNRGIREAKGDFILWLDSDDVLEPDTLKRYVQCFQNYSDADVYYGNLHITNDQLDVHRELNYDDWYNRNAELISKMAFGNYLPNPGTVIRKSAFERIGYYNEAFVRAHDYEWYSRALASCKFKHVGHFVIKWRWHDTNMSTESVRYDTQYEALIALNMFKNYSLEQLLPHIDWSSTPAEKGAAIAHLNLAARFTNLRQYDLALDFVVKSLLHFPSTEGYDLLEKIETNRNHSDRNIMVSVIIPTFNRREYLPQAIQSVLKQNIAGLEIIVVNDDGDDVSDIIEKIGKRDVIRLLNNNSNQGLSYSRNQGIKTARGKYIALLDDDDQFLENHLQTAINHLSPKHPVIYSDAVRVTYEKQGDQYVAVSQTVPYSMDFDRDKLLLGNIAPVNCFVFERQLALKCGLFDESLTTLEDWDFWIRLSRLADFVHLPEVTVQVNWRSDGTTLTSSRQIEFARNREIIYQRNREQIKQIKNIPQIMEEFKAIWSQDVGPQNQSRPNIPETANDSLPLVSIIMLTWNALEYTKKCVKSIEENTHVPYEIIFVDNGSKDGTKKYLKSRVKVNPNYKLINNSKNMGFAAGNNQGVKKARGEYVLILNNDVLVGEGWLDSMLQSLQKDEKIGIVGPITNSISGLQMVQNIPYEGDNFAEFAGKVRKVNSGKLTPRRRLAGFAMLLKKSLYQEIGGFDESFAAGNFEDDDLCLRVKEKGYALMVDESTFIHHYGSQTFKANNMDYNASLQEKGKYFREKWPEVDYEELLELKNPLSLVHDQLVAEALKHLQDDRLEQAAEKYKQIINDNPLSREALFGCGTVLMNQTNYDEALLIYNRLVGIDPNDAQAYNQIGVLFKLKEDFEAAKASFALAIQKDPTLLDAQRNYGDILIETADYENGIRVFYKILENHPDDIPSLIYMANLCVEAERFSGAERYLQLVLAMDPHNDLANQLKDILVQLSGQKTPADTADAINTATQESIDELITRANTNLEQGKLDEAAREYEHVLQGNPTRIEALYGLGLIERMREKWDSATRYFQKIIEIEAHFSPAYTNLGGIAYAGKNFDEAYKWLAKALASNPFDLETRHLLTEVLIELGRFEEAIQLIMDTLKENPGDVPTLIMVGKLHYEAGKEQESRDYFEQAIRIEPQNEVAQYFLQTIEA